MRDKGQQLKRRSEWHFRQAATTRYQADTIRIRIHTAKQNIQAQQHVFADSSTTHPQRNPENTEVGITQYDGGHRIAATEQDMMAVTAT